MGPPGSPPVKKAKLPSALETKLEKLRKTLDMLRDLWKLYDPGYFMTTMHQIRDQVRELTPSTIQEFITSRECDELPDLLKALDRQLLIPSTETDPEMLELTRTMRKRMSTYVEDIRQSLKGQS